MALAFIPTQVDHRPDPQIDRLIMKLREQFRELGLDGGIMYYGWPKYTDYQSVRHKVDIAIISRKTGVILIRVLSSGTRNVAEAQESVSQVSATAMSQLVRSPLLREKSRQLKVAVTPIIFAPGQQLSSSEDIDCFSSEPALLRFIQDMADQDLTYNEFAETRSILEGAKALVRPTKRLIEDIDSQKLGAALAKLEEEIASFDERQRQVALTTLGCPQRIRGLAGSGKTIILAMKAAMAHLDNPDANILVTYYTRSLRDHLTRLITRFHRHFGERDPDWKRVHIYHGWGRKDLPGVYREASLRAGFSPMNYGAASAASAVGQNAFDYACRTLLESKAVKPFYDLVLIDEGQDFPTSFYELCFYLAKGERDRKQIVWAYDELQNVFDVTVPTPDQLFGKDTDGQPRISLSRSLPEAADTNDFVLPKCYRNQRDILVLAHATGFGIYGQPVQMLQDRAHWHDVGYEVEAGNMNVNTEVTIKRPDRNSPTHLKTPTEAPLIQVKRFATAAEEITYCVEEFRRFIDGGLQPEDLMAIAIDDRSAQRYLSALAQALAANGITSNNIIADRYSEPAFLIEGKCTLSTVYRAKGNEAAVVAVLGCDAVPLKTRSGRNRLFTAFTRTKGWLRITGMGSSFDPIEKEIKKAIELAPMMKFKMPDPERIEMIQRDLSERDSRVQRAQAEMERIKETLGLSDDDLRAALTVRPKNGRK